MALVCSSYSFLFRLWPCVDWYTGPALKYADMIEPAEGASGSSHTVLSTYFQPHQFSYVLRNICSEFGLQSAR